MQKCLTAIEMLIQKFHKARIASAALDQSWDVMDDIECVGPHVTFSPPGVLACPAPIRVASFHKSRIRVEYCERGHQGTVAEKNSVV